MNWNGHEPQLVNPNILSCKASSAPPSPWWRHLNKSQLTCDSTEHISTNNNKYIVYIYIRVTSDPATSKRAKMFIKTAPYHHDYSWLPLIWGIGHIQPVKAALINCRLFSRQLSPTAASQETAGRLQLDHWWSMHVFRIISSRCDLTAEFEAMLCQKRGFALLTLREQWTLAPRLRHDANPVWTNVLGSRQARNRQQQATNLQPNLWFGNFSGWLDWLDLWKIYKSRCPLANH